MRWGFRNLGNRWVEVVWSVRGWRKHLVELKSVAGEIPSSLVAVFLHPLSTTLTTIISVRNPFSTKLISLSMNLKLLWMIDFLISITSWFLLDKRDTIYHCIIDFYFNLRPILQSGFSIFWTLLTNENCCVQLQASIDTMFMHSSD